MAVKARAEITLSSIRDIQSVTRYYLLQSSTSAVPTKPTTNPPGGNWVTAEPTYTTGSTNSLYFTDCTVFSDGTFVYSDVSLSSSYEAAKVAYNKAENAEAIAERATHSPNLTPYGSRSFDDTHYWYNGHEHGGVTGSTGVIWNTEQLADGWIHICVDATGYTGTAKYVSDNAVVRTSPSFKKNTLYTILYEIRNNNSVLAETSANNTQFYIQESNSRVFWGNAVTEVLEGSGASGSFILRTMAPEANTTYRKRFTKMSDSGTHAGSNPPYLFQMQHRYGAGDYIDFELRISIYEGRYLGDYMPYIVSDTTELETDIKAAQETANGKNTVYYQTSAPTGGTYKTNDIWFDTNNGNKMYMWNGSAWTPEQFGNAAISDLSITNAKIANGTIESAKISNLDAGKITSGTMSAARIKGDELKLGGDNNTDGVMKVYNADGELVGSFTKEGLMAIAGTIAGWTIEEDALTGTQVVGTQHWETRISKADGIRFKEYPQGSDPTVDWTRETYYNKGLASYSSKENGETHTGAIENYPGEDGLRIYPKLTVGEHGGLAQTDITQNQIDTSVVRLKELWAHPLGTGDTFYLQQPVMIMAGVKTVNQTGTSTKSLTLCTVPSAYQSGYRIVPFVSRRYDSASGVPSDDGDFYYAYYNSVSHEVCIKLVHNLPTGVIYQFDYMIYAVPETT